MRKPYLLFSIALLSIFTSCEKENDSDPDENDPATTSSSGLTITVGTKTFRYNDAQVNVDMKGPIAQMHWEKGEGSGALNWHKPEVFTYLWTDASDDNTFWFEPEGWKPKSVFLQKFNDQLTNSAGSIRITAVGAVGGIVSGEFVIEQSGQTNTESGNAEYLGATKVTGSFRLIRDR